MWIVCSYPCSSCSGESSSCLNCVDLFVLNETTCISNDQCLSNGYIANGTCFGFLFLLFFKKEK